MIPGISPLPGNAPLPFFSRIPLDDAPHDLLLPPGVLPPLVNIH